MKKKLLLTLSLLILISAFSTAYSKTNISSELSESIKLYKAKNYSECYVKLDSVIKKEPGNALAYYYKAITATQLGKKDEAISNYEKVLELSPNANNLSRYAAKGKKCIETPDKCSESSYESADDKFIRTLKGPKFSDEVRSEYERLKIDEMRRTINRDEDIAPARFKEYKDFSSMNIDNGTPSNDEIVAAIRTLQKAGMYNDMTSAYSDLSLISGRNYNNAALLNSAGISSMSPQLIQTMLTNNMSLGF